MLAPSASAPPPNSCHAPEAMRTPTRSLPPAARGASRCRNRRVDREERRRGRDEPEPDRRHRRPAARPSPRRRLSSAAASVRPHDRIAQPPNDPSPHAPMDTPRGGADTLPVYAKRRALRSGQRDQGGGRRSGRAFRRWRGGLRLLDAVVACCSQPALLGRARDDTDWGQVRIHAEGAAGASLDLVASLESGGAVVEAEKVKAEGDEQSAVRGVSAGVFRRPGPPGHGARSLTTCASRWTASCARGRRPRA